MSAALLHRLCACGITLRADGPYLDCEGPEGRLTPALLGTIAANKGRLLDLVRGLPSHTHGLVNKIVLGDALDVLKQLPNNSIDLIATDPPYGYGFMGKHWDRALPDPAIWRECLRVLKPGGFAFILAAPRQDVLSRVIIALDDAGFVTAFTSIYWTYASGFPKAHNTAKAVDKKLGAKRTIVAEHPLTKAGFFDKVDEKGRRYHQSATQGYKLYEYQGISASASAQAKALDGSYVGFQPKPAVEVILVVMKPLVRKNFTEQAMANGKGITWLDDCRIPFSADGEGRFPANLVVSDSMLGNHSRFFSLDAWAEGNLPFLIVSKASTREKNAGLMDLSEKTVSDGRKTINDTPFQRDATPRKNTHPTVKPIKLMAYLVTMGSREGDIVLDPFAGSGTTLIAAQMLNRRFIGIEMEPEYHRIAEERLAFHASEMEQRGESGRLGPRFGPEINPGRSPPRLLPQSVTEKDPETGHHNLPRQSNRDGRCTAEPATTDLQHHLVRVVKPETICPGQQIVTSPELRIKRVITQLKQEDYRMIHKRGQGDFPRVYRPCNAEELYGQDDVRRLIVNGFRDNTIAHAYLFHGTSGTGKTTCARIIGMGLMCEHGPTNQPCGQCKSCRAIMASASIDFRELNNANLTGVDVMRRLREDFFTGSMFGNCKVFVFDECHRLSAEAQNLLLKEVEDAHDGVYFIFCSTEPDKIIEPLRNRCIEVEFKPLADDQVRRLLADVCRHEGLVPSAEVIEPIIKEAQGRARNALHLLQKAIATGDMKKAADAGTVAADQIQTDSNPHDRRSLMKSAAQSQTQVVKSSGKAVSAGSKADKPKTAPNKGLMYHAGNPKLSVIAPHGYKGDEPGTAQIADRMRQFLGCGAIINARVPKKERNYNRIDQANKDKTYIDALRNAAAATDGHPLAVFVHGIEDGNIKDEAKRLGIGNGTLKAVVGYGQPDNTCARKETAKAVIKALNDNGIHAEAAYETEDGYCAAHENVMTQWFKANGFKGVDAVQIELKATGVRDVDSRTQTAISLARALSEVTGLPLPANIAKKPPLLLLPAPAEGTAVQKGTAEDHKSKSAQHETEADAALVDTVHAKLRDIVGSAAQDMMAREQKATLEAGRYLIEVFYGNDYNLAEQGKMTRKASFRVLEDRLRSSTAEGPKKSWLHNAVKVAVAEHRINSVEDQDVVHTYGQLGLSQKVLLLPLSHQERVEFVKENAGETLTVAETRERIAEFKAAKNPEKGQAAHAALSEAKPTDDRDRLKRSAKELADSIEVHHRQIAQQVAGIEKIETELQQLPATGSGFTEWTDQNVNICNGCFNDCRYCYAKAQAHRYGQVAKDRWAEQVVRPHDVEASRRFYPGWVGFPSTHDIIPEILDDYLTVLGKLLRAGNKVMIVSKPRQDCIRAICDASRFFRDRLMFRFSIGAMDDQILGFWEPNAPTFDERKQALRYAFEAGFATSVSAEPMLDADHVVELVEDLAPYVSADLWIGKMHYMPRLDKVLPEQRVFHEQVRAGQSEERIAQLYEVLKDHPLVRWKKKTLPQELAEDHHRRRLERLEGKARGALVADEPQHPTAPEAASVESDPAPKAPVVVSASYRTDIAGCLSE